MLVPYVARGVDGCRLDGNRATLDAPSDDAPAVVLIEDQIGPDWRGTFVAWADGAVVFDPAVAALPDTREAAMRPADVEALRAALVRALAGQAPHRSLGFVDPSTGARSVMDHGDETTIIVRDGDGWRVATIFGVGRDDVLGPLSPPEPGPHGTVHEPVPPWFRRAFQLALAAIPRNGRPFVPYAYHLELFTDQRVRLPGTRGSRLDDGAPMPWPEDLPAPPATLEPRRCDYVLQGTSPDAKPCRFVVPHAHADAARRTRAVANTPSQVRRVVFAGQAWILSFRPRYRGQDTISHVKACAAAHPSPSP